MERVTISPPGVLPDPGMEPRSLMSPALAGPVFTTSATWQAVAGIFSTWGPSLKLGSDP